MSHVHCSSYMWELVNIPHIVFQIGIVGNPLLRKVTMERRFMIYEKVILFYEYSRPAYLLVALEVAHIDLVKTNQSNKQTNIGLGKHISTEVPLA